MVRVAFELDRAAIAVLDQQSATRAASPTRRGIVIRLAGDDLVRRREIRNGVLNGRPLTAGQSRARKCKAVQLHQITYARSAPLLSRFHKGHLYTPPLPFLFTLFLLPP